MNIKFLDFFYFKITLLNSKLPKMGVLNMYPQFLSGVQKKKERKKNGKKEKLKLRKKIWTILPARRKKWGSFAMPNPKWPSIYWPTSSWLVYLKPSSVLIILASKCLSFDLWINNAKIVEKCAKKNFGVSFHYLVFIGKLISSWVPIL